MRQPVITLTLAAVISASSGLAWAGPHEDGNTKKNSNEGQKQSVQLGPRPFFLVNDMRESELKDKLLSCSDGPFEKTDFSIGHRGAALQFPDTPGKPTKPAPVWAQALSNAT